MKPTAATVLPAPVACSNQKRRSAPGSSGASSTASSASSPAACSSQSCGSSSGASSSGSSCSSPQAPPRPHRRPRRRSPPRRPFSSSGGVGGLLLGHQLGQGPGEGIDLMRVQLGAVEQLRRFVGEQPLEPEQQREVAAPLDRRALGAGLDLGQGGVEGAAPGGAPASASGPSPSSRNGSRANSAARSISTPDGTAARATTSLVLAIEASELPSHTDAQRPPTGTSENEETGSRTVSPPALSRGPRSSGPNVRIVAMEMAMVGERRSAARCWRSCSWGRLRREDGGGGHPDYAKALAGAPAPLAALHRQGNDLLGGGRAAYEKRIESLRGYPIVVNVWASWCGPCRFEFPALQRMPAKYGKRVAFLGIDLEDSDDAARTFLDSPPSPTRAIRTPTRDRRVPRRLALSRDRVLQPRGRARLSQTGSVPEERPAGRHRRRYACESG